MLRDHGHRREVADGVVGQTLEGLGIGDQRCRSGEEEGVAVGGRPSHSLSPHHVGGAGPILDDDLVAQTCVTGAPRSCGGAVSVLRGCVSIFVGHSVPEDAEPAHLDLDDVAGPQPERWIALRLDPACRPGYDDTVRLESGEGRAVFDLARNIEDHLGDRRLLTTFTLSRVCRRSRDSSPSSSGVIIHGPNAPVP